jgi:hypothetical protein
MHEGEEQIKSGQHVVQDARLPLSADDAGSDHHFSPLASSACMFVPQETGAAFSGGSHSSAGSLPSAQHCRHDGTRAYRSTCGAPAVQPPQRLHEESQNPNAVISDFQPWQEVPDAAAPSACSVSAAWSQVASDDPVSTREAAHLIDLLSLDAPLPAWPTEKAWTHLDTSVAQPPSLGAGSPVLANGFDVAQSDSLGSRGDGEGFVNWAEKRRPSSHTSHAVTGFSVPAPGSAQAAEEHAVGHVTSQGSQGIIELSHPQLSSQAAQPAKHCEKESRVHAELAALRQQVVHLSCMSWSHSTPAIRWADQCITRYTVSRPVLAPYSICWRTLRTLMQRCILLKHGCCVLLHIMRMSWGAGCTAGGGARQDAGPAA